MEYSTKELIKIINNDDPKSNSYIGALDIYRKLMTLTNH